MKTNSTSGLVGDFLVIVSADGEAWDGRKWVEGWERAKHFAPLPEAYDACVAEAARIRKRSGVRCRPVYIQPHRRPLALQNR